jgi:hypothetical protein
MARSSQHCAIIYVSTDARHEEMQVETHNKPYFSMVFQDGSDFAPMARSEEEMKLALAEVTDVARDEWFVSAEVGSASRSDFTSSWALIGRVCSGSGSRGRAVYSWPTRGR